MTQKSSKRSFVSRVGVRNFTIAVVALLAIPVAATAADLLPNDDNKYAVSSDKAAKGSVANGAVAVDGMDRPWGVRKFKNERGEKCADAGRLISGTPSINTGNGWQPVSPGQDGVCVAKRDAPVIGSQMLPASAGGVSIVYGVVPPTISSVTVGFDGDQASAVPAADGTFIAVLDKSPLDETGSAKERNDQLLSVMGDSSKTVSIELNFSDGSSLSLREQKVARGRNASATGSLADKAKTSLTN